LELAERVRRVLGTRNEIVVKGKPEAGAKPSVYVPEIGRAQGELGLSVSVSLDEAIRRTVARR
jgi:nucleoside-diphosphate-sugar epimerase